MALDHQPPKDHRVVSIGTEIDLILIREVWLMYKSKNAGN